jgi:ParB family transcriptional regulator, chromosome partitioning protein
MATTRSMLAGLHGHLQESLGVRFQEAPAPLSPVPRGKDVGRSPLRNIGKIAIDLVHPDPEQPRTEFSDEAIARLAQSVRDKGQLSPIHVRWDDGLTQWIIVSGERRWRAMQRAGLKTIDCCFHEDDLSRSEILEQQLIENLLREDLQPIEEAKAFAALIELNGWTGRQLAEALRIAPSKVTRALALLKLPADVQERIEAGDVSARSGYEISKLADERQQRALAERAATHAETARAVRQRRGVAAAKPRGTRQTFVTPDGWTVVVRCPRKGNYHEVEQALSIALDEVRHRIRNNVQLF